MITLTKNTKHKTNKHPKVPLYQYGVLITKPWSKEMYDHNDGVAEVVISNLNSALRKALDEFDGDPSLVICTSADYLYTIAKTVCGHGWSGYSVESVYNDAVRELKRVQNFWLNQEYPDLVNAGLCPQVEPFFVGY